MGFDRKYWIYILTWDIEIIRFIRITQIYDIYTGKEMQI